MEAGGNSKGWISGGTVEGRGRARWRARPGKAFLQRGRATVGPGGDAAPGGEAAQKLRPAFVSTGKTARGERKVPRSRERQEAVSTWQGHHATSRTEKRRPPEQSRPCSGESPGRPPRHVPAEIPPQHSSARRKAIIRWMLFLKALDSDPAIIFLIT